LRPILANDNKQTKITPTTGLGTVGVKENKSKKEPADRRRRRRKKEQVIYRGALSVYAVRRVHLSSTCVCKLLTHVNGEIRPWEDSELRRLFGDVAKEFYMSSGINLRKFFSTKLLKLLGFFFVWWL
jgi:hypothetical protein